MSNLNHLIDLNGLKTFLENIWVKVKNYVDSKFEATTKKVDAATWVGKEEDIPGAIERGEIIPGYTFVTISDDDDKEIIYMWTTEEEIYALFGMAPSA